MRFPMSSIQRFFWSPWYALYSLVPTRFMLTWHTNYSYLKGGNLNWGNSSIEFYYIAFLISDWLGRTQLMVGGSIPELVVLGFKRKQAEQAVRSKPAGSTRLLALYQLLSPGSWSFELLFLGTGEHPRLSQGTGLHCMFPSGWCELQNWGLL